jgi:hypothetical protein
VTLLLGWWKQDSFLRLKFVSHRYNLFENNNSEGRESQGCQNCRSIQQKYVALDVRYFRFIPPERWDLKCSPHEMPCFQHHRNVLQVVASRRSVVDTFSNFSEDVADEGEIVGPNTCLGDQDGLYRRRKFLKLDVVWLWSGLRKTLVQIETRTNSCSFHLPRLRQVKWSETQKDTFYCGLGSWFPLTPGRDMFREARCPLYACTITLDTTQTADADAILNHGMFLHPGHPRPPKEVQAWNISINRDALHVMIEWWVLIRLPEIRYSNSIWKPSLFVISHWFFMWMLQ